MTSTNTDCGYIQCYTGDGKGKTTSVIGQLIRSHNAGLKCCLVQFFKAPISSEILFLKNTLGLDILSFYSKCKNEELHKQNEELHKKELIKVKHERKKGEAPFCADCFKEHGDELEIAKTGFEEVKKLIVSEKYDVIVLDEIGFVLSKNLISNHDFVAMLNNKPKHTEIILTGRGIPNEVIAISHLVTECREIKHYKQCRRGFEF